MGYHPKEVADFGTSHGYDLTSDTDRREVAEEFIRSGKAPSGIAAGIIVWHLNEYLAGRSVGLYEPDGTTRAPGSEDGKYAIKVGETEYDHADTPEQAKRARDALIYGEIGTPEDTTIERRK
jgi:hypothetical protein